MPEEVNSPTERNLDSFNREVGVLPLGLAERMNRTRAAEALRSQDRV